MLNLYVSPLLFDIKKNQVKLGDNQLEWKKQIATVAKKKELDAVEFLNQKYGPKLGPKPGSIVFAHFDYIEDSSIYLLYTPNPKAKPLELELDTYIPADIQIVEESPEIETTDDRIIIHGDVYGFCLDNKTFYFKDIDVIQYIEFVQRDNHNVCDEANEDAEYVDSSDGEYINDSNIEDDSDTSDEDSNNEEDELEDELEDDNKQDNDRVDEEDDEELEDADEDDDEIDEDEKDKKNSSKSLKGKKLSKKNTKQTKNKEGIDGEEDANDEPDAEGEEVIEIDDGIEDDEDASDMDAPEQQEPEDGEAEGEPADLEEATEFVDFDQENEDRSVKKKKPKTSRGLKLGTNADFSILFNILPMEPVDTITPESQLHDTRQLNIGILRKLGLAIKMCQLIEKGIYNYTIDKCNSRLVVPIWDNPEFSDIYISKAKNLFCNLNSKCYVGNTKLIEKIKSGEIKPYDLAFIDTHKLFIERWTDIIEENTKREKMIRDSIQECASDLFQCPRCHKRKTIYVEVQTRSSDEPMTKFITCLECGKRWKKY